MLLRYRIVISTALFCMLSLKSFLTLLLCSSMLSVVSTGCKKAGDPDLTNPVPERTLVKSTLIGEYSQADLRNRFTGVSSVLQVFIRNDIRVYRIEYNTTNTDGKLIRASGALLIPTGNAVQNKALPLLSMQHGTITDEGGAPSNYTPGNEAYTYGSVFASQGYIISAPDYIGYGASKDLPHPYEHNKSLASASLDMLRASREFIADNKLNWDSRLFVAGYSEGGYATMALQKKIEEETNGEFNLVASSCGAGAYDKPAFMREIINSRTSGVGHINRLYVWVLTTYDRIYGLNRPATTYFKSPYAAQVTAQGNNTDITVSLNTTFTDSFKAAVNNGTDQAFLKAVQDNDIHDWKPRTPTRLYHGDADDTVFYLNSVNAYEAMQKRGALNVELKPLRGANHATGIIGFITGTYEFFGGIQ